MGGRGRFTMAINHGVPGVPWVPGVPGVPWVPGSKGPWVPSVPVLVQFGPVYHRGLVYEGSQIRQGPVYPKMPGLGQRAGLARGRS